MSHGDPLKWHMPGWRIEQKYAPGVLIGNWSEGRYNFVKGNSRGNSTYRVDFMNFGNHRPDIIIRRKGQIRNEGLPAEHLIHHHGKAYSKNMISWYDEDYNKRKRELGDELPMLRKWDGNELAWLPEKTDHPMQGAPTNYGLLNKRAADWSNHQTQETHSDYNTTYSASFKRQDNSAMAPVRYATARENSSHLLRFNQTNKNLALRGTVHYQLPDIVPSVERPPGRMAMPAAVAAQPGIGAS
ncbi:hypothetical protein CAPTEDRAFT_19088 [Capitella teleta]|uniref:Uncharacterized protein n=1 Tax=Capitella teleta TaxID=283909 RepID=R7V944_CAPTE|nr:hypothetical protein CAPTEDRAFT_19088 [Capitella teleta]|eukprot:ELU12240.1 hypothetical protein CAPTEDRAFT_19088 [Capitella teleta]